MTTIAVRDVELFVEVVGDGYPLLLMHGGPGADHWTLLPFRQLSDSFTVVFYDHRCNGRSADVPVTSMTWDNLTADAEALRTRLGFSRWAVLGHSFGGKVALEYALRYPDSVSHLILLDTGGDSWWERENAPRLLARRGFPAGKVELARRWFSGRTAPWEFFPTLIRLGSAYDPHTNGFAALRTAFAERRFKARPQAHIFGFRRLTKDWTVMDRLKEITVPTLVMAGRDDFVFPPEHQAQLASGIPGARLEIIEHAGHNPHDEQTAAVMTAVRDFIEPGREVPQRRDAVRRFNKRFLNPVMLLVAGRRYWYAAALHHVGRRSGRPYTTPVVAEPVGGGFVIPLPYGDDVDWLRNIRAAGRASIEVHGRRYTLDDPRVVDAGYALPLVRRSRRRVWQRLGIRHYLQVHAVATPQR
ncbi:alpha/beta fold hydrolase [Actinoplanes sp. NPDC049599]|uniref:alpha/beta fold hydrolase n=1 Tax=Actinoplanes sp. NPDC049599 TaxID=3363903 RepID=UPI0037B28488